ncbi:MAG: T9SS type A sorting domain-containing protein [Chitinophagaceae bacterium]|nr:T9SS type A sorting domain-containing protein [Panacibacter sp.]
MRIYTLLIVIIAEFFTGKIYALEIEPNDTRSTANALAFNFTEQGTCNINDVDYWKVTTLSDGMLTVDFSTLSTRCLVLTLVSENGSELFTQPNINGNVSISFSGLAQGNYYYKINSCQGIDSNPYSINVSFTSVGTENDLEPNNSMMQAIAITENNIKIGHVGFRTNNLPDEIDYYQLTTNQDGALQINLQSTNGHKVSLSLLNDAGIEIGNIGYTTSTGTLSLAGLAKGTYFISVIPYTPDFATYKIETNFTPPNQPNDAEPNNVVLQAIPFALGSTETGHLAYYDNHLVDDADWYYVDVNEDGKLQIQCSNNFGVDIVFGLYDGDGVNQLTTIVLKSNTTGTLVKEGLAPGKYFLIVAPLSYSPSVYTVSSGLIEATPANDIEPNDNIDQASVLKTNELNTGHLGFTYLKAGNAVDWLKITITKTSTLNYTLQNNSGYPVYLDFYDKDSVTKLETITSSNGNSSNLVKYALAPGTYFFKIYCDLSGWATYTFSNASSEISFYNTYLNENNFLAYSPTDNSDPDTLKLCADGSRATYFDFVNKSFQNVGFRIKEDLAGTQKDIYGFLDNPVSVGLNPQTLRVIYNHPMYLSGSSLSRDATIQIYDISNGTVIYEYPIRIYRAPLLLVHGLWGNTTSFQLFQEKLVLVNGLYPRSFPWITNNAISPLIYKADYERSNDESFKSNNGVVKLNVELLIRQALREGFSCGKVDIIAHSMGGILSRSYIQNPYNSIPYRGDVHKLITLNTPHAGTQLADFGVGIACPAISLISLYITQGLSALLCPLVKTYSPALVDLGVNSDAMNNYINGPSWINTRLVPTMALTSRITENYNDPDCNWLEDGLAPTLDLFKGAANDGVVPVISQQGGIKPYSITLDNICHIGCMNDNQMYGQAVTLINSPTVPVFFDVDGYLPQRLTFPATNKSMQAIAATQAVKFFSPSNNSIFSPGDIISVTARGTASIKKMQMVVGNEVFEPFSFDTSGNKLFYNYTVPQQSSGEMRVMVVGYDSLYQYVFDTLRIYIQPNSELDSLSIYPNNITVLENLKTSFEITGYYHDGYTRNISSLPEISYLINDTTVAVHTSKNEIQGNNRDTTSLTISYLGKTNTVSVTVLNGADYLHAGFVTFDTLVCRTQQVHFTNYSTGSPDSVKWVLTGATPSISTEQNPIVVYNKTGIYNATLICYYRKKNDTLLLSQYIRVINKVPARPGTIVISKGSNRTCAGDTISYTINPVANATSYLWKVPAGATILSGQGSISVKVFYSTAFIKTDSVSVAALNSCGTSPIRYLKIILKCNSFNALYASNAVLSKDAKLNVFPNPFKNTLYVKGDFNSTRNSRIILSDLVGRIYYDKLVDGNSSGSEINTTRLQRGFYFLIIQTDNKREVFKVEKL